MGKRMKRGIFILILISFFSCNTVNQESVLYSNSMGLVEGSPLINDYGKTVLERFDAPLGYNRVSVSPHPFASYLRTHMLETEGSLFQFYNGKTKSNNNVYVSVV